ncbi:DUF7694 domain-containing protein [Pseudaestuariivita sp.]|uniref:DUF7694 domain-containing protein n=1 Tax=Pseudaestuariivita sp. TaxID=2211669 RepID=UPI0040595935
MSDPIRCTFYGFATYLDEELGHLWVEHDGTITWDQLQAIKSAVWGAEARAIEVYPAEGNVINAANIRHLWRLGPMDFAPDLVGEDGFEDSLQTRFADAWAEARR